MRASQVHQNYLLSTAAILLTSLMYECFWSTGDHRARRDWSHCVLHGVRASAESKRRPLSGILHNILTLFAVHKPAYVLVFIPSPHEVS